MQIPRAWSISSATASFVRHFSRKCERDLRRINPKVPWEEAKAISKGLAQILRDNGPLTVSETWDHAKEAITGLNSKTHLKIMLKWMRGRNILKLYCTHDRKHKKFLHSALPRQSQPSKVKNPRSCPEAPALNSMVQK